jgi:lipopolysaccharide/colanic/teichoic acid biosynthesis glycosyltransferase
MNSRLRFYILGSDVIWLAMALGLSYGLRYSQLKPFPPAVYSFLVLAGIGVWALLFTTLSLDCFDGGWRFHVAVGKMIRATCVLMILIIVSAYLARLYYSRLLLIYFGVLLFLGFLLIRVGMYLFLRTRYRRGHARKVVLVGNERFTREFAFKIGRHPELLYQVVGMLYPVGDGMALDSGTSAGQPLSSFDVLRAFSERRVDELIVLQDETPGLEFQSFVARCRAQVIRVNVLPRGYELYTSKPKLIEIDGLPLITLERPSTLPGAAALKRVMDLLISTLLLPPAVCIFIGVAAVLLWNKRRVLRRELRIGKGGRPFWMYRLDVDRRGEEGPTYERLMRDLSISEIPQLWNVLLGDMSLVGPRPEPPERVKHYSDWQKERLKAKPGVTGLAQVNGLREHHGSEEKARFDLQYLLEWSPFNDLVLILQTLGTLAKRCLLPSESAERQFDASHGREQSLTTKRDLLPGLARENVPILQIRPNKVI